MPLLIYAYDADSLPSLLEETADAEEAVATCRALVEEDGYPRAEVWGAAGDRLYAVLRTGAAVLTIGSAAEVEASAPARRREFAELPPAAPRAALERDHDLVVTGVADARDGAATTAAPEPTAPAEPAEPPAPDNLLGDRPGRTELWFGL